MLLQHPGTGKHAVPYAKVTASRLVLGLVVHGSNKVNNVKAALCLARAPGLSECGTCGEAESMPRGKGDAILCARSKRHD